MSSSNINTFTEKDGKPSFSRLLGAGIIIGVFAITVVAVFKDRWSEVVSLSIALLGLAGALYGFNKWRDINGSGTSEN